MDHERLGSARAARASDPQPGHTPPTLSKPTSTPNHRPRRATSRPLYIEGGEPLNRAVDATRTDRARTPNMLRPAVTSTTPTSVPAPKISRPHRRLQTAQDFNLERFPLPTQQSKLKLPSLPRLLTSDQTFSHRHLSALPGYPLFPFPSSLSAFFSPKSWPAASPFPLATVEPPLCVSDRLLLVRPPVLGARQTTARAACQTARARLPPPLPGLLIRSCLRLQQHLLPLNSFTTTGRSLKCLRSWQISSTSNSAALLRPSPFLRLPPRGHGAHARLPRLRLPASPTSTTSRHTRDHHSPPRHSAN